MTTRWLVLVVLFGCGTDVPPIASEPPAPPDANDPAYTVRSIKDWYIVGNAVTPGDDAMTFFVDAPAGTKVIDAWVGTLPPVRMDKQADGSFGAQLAITDLAPGTYDVLLAADGESTAFAKLPINRSTPYYVVVSTDWDFSDPGTQVIAFQNTMHMEHPELRITHFVGPYTFTDPAVTADRQQELVDWLLMNRDTHHDEIGLHIHPYCNFVEHAGLTCITDQSTVYATDTTGYTIKVGAYTREQFGTLLQHASDLFVQHGLNVPKTFRAGGWTATLDTFNALVDHDFHADTSALNWARIEEWKDKNSGELYRWTMEHWAPINDTSQPYFPSQTDVLATTAPAMPMLEVPDNGVMIDYVTQDEMNGLFDANWVGGVGQPLMSPSVLMMGFHPSTTFSYAEFGRVEGLLKYADMHLANRHEGPVVYITLDDLVAVYR
jgi:hypothetical protein